MKKKDISRYTSFFHDGELIEISHKEDSIILFIKSAEVNPSDVQGVILSKDHVIRGKLHVEGITLLLENGKKVSEIIKKFPDNDILHLKIKKNILFCEIGWRGSQSFQNDFSALEIHAQKIWWENIPESR